MPKEGIFSEKQANEPCFRREILRESYNNQTSRVKAVSVYKHALCFIINNNNNNNNNLIFILRKIHVNMIKCALH